MNVLIAYGSGEGHTRKIAKTITGQLKDMGHETVLFDTAGLLGGIRPDNFDRIILAGSVHEQRHPESLEVFVEANRNKFADVPVLFISVSLAAAFEEGLSDAQSYVDRFYRTVDWHAGRSLLVAGAVKHSEYGFYREQFLKHVVLKDRPVESIDDDLEFTDWKFIAEAVKEFVEGS